VRRKIGGRADGQVPSGFAAELRECEKEACRKPALSDTWIYCPYCGTKLPPAQPVALERLFREETVIGDKYINRTWKFQIERPNEKWKFVTGKAVKEYNDEAEVGIISPKEDVCVMVMEEALPSISLVEYLDRVAPEFEDRVKLYEKMETINGLETISAKLGGKYYGMDVVYIYMIYAREEDKCQIIGYYPKSSDTPEITAHVDVIQRSFRSLDK